MTWHNFDSDDDHDDDDCCSNGWILFWMCVCVCKHTQCVHKCESDWMYCVRMFKYLSDLMNHPTYYYLRTFKHHYFILFRFILFRFLFDWYLKWFEKSKNSNPELLLSIESIFISWRSPNISSKFETMCVNVWIFGYLDCGYGHYNCLWAV